MLKKLLLFGCLLILVSGHKSVAASPPDEGMWLPMYLSKLNFAEMQRLGLKLTAEQLYDINNSSLKDAVVQFGNGCTGEVISKDGLLLTNHHCGYEAIQSHSSVEKDYLTNGFWAMKRSEELPNPNLTVSFLVRMENVTPRILSGLTDAMSEPERAAAVAAASKQLEKDAAQGNGYRANVRAVFNGNEYYLFVYETYRDVRLVGAPPSAIGKFGGDTDNWMWPRHTGDFSMFRIYSGKDGKPADYSADNIPLKPKHWLPVSLGGVKENDFAMIFGFPGRTDRYLTSYGVKQALEQSNPLRVKIRGRKLELMKQDMDADKKVQIQYASKYAQVSNYWKYFIGQSQGLKRLKVADKKEQEERNFNAWVNADAARKAKYGIALSNIEAQYKLRSGLLNAQIVYGEGIAGTDFALLAGSLEELPELLAKDKEAKGEETQKTLAKLKANAEELFKDYNRSTDEKLMAAAIGFYKTEVPATQWPEEVAKAIAKSKNADFAAFVHKMYDASFISDKAKLESFLAAPKASVLEKDPGFKFVKSIGKSLKDMSVQSRAISGELERNNRLYVGGTLAMNPDKKYYPNANSTMRVTYGNVLDYSPRDAVEYNYFTTLEGVIQKEDSSNEEFVVPAKLKELWRKKDYGQYGENGTVKVAFLSNTDITGGNSGSPVINAKGELIGLAFDGNWEAMSGDIAFEPALQRTISVDIRYVLFIIDKYAGAKHLVDEMTLAKAETAPAPPAPAMMMMMQKPAAAPAAPETPAKAAKAGKVGAKAAKESKKAAAKK